MNNFFKVLLAGYGAKKLGGGCLSTIVIFVVIYFALGQCNRASATEAKRESVQKYQEVLPNLEIKKEQPLYKNYR